MQKFVLLSTVASAAAFLAEDTPAPAVAEPAVDAAPTTDGVEPTTDDGVDPATEDAALNEEEKKELEFTFEKPAAAEGAKKVQPKFNVQKKEFFTCPATGANLLGKKLFDEFVPAKAGKSLKKQQDEFYEVCQQACQQNEKCAGLEIEYESYLTRGGVEKFATVLNGPTKYDTAAGGFLESCAMVGKTDLVQYGDLLKKVKKLTTKEERDVAKRVEWVNKVDNVVKEALEKLGETADATERAPEWNFEKAEKEAKKKNPTRTLFDAVTSVGSKHIYEEWRADSPFQCVKYVNWENIPEQSLRQFLETRAQKVTEIAAEVDAAEQGSAEAAKAVLKLKIVEDQLTAERPALDALKIDSAESTKRLEVLEEKTAAAKAVIAEQDAIKSTLKTQKSLKWKNAHNEAIKQAQQIVKFEAETKKIEEELAFQAILGKVFDDVQAEIATAAAKAKAVEAPVEPSSSTPVEPSTTSVDPSTPVEPSPSGEEPSKPSGPSGPTGSEPKTPVKPSADTKKTETKKTGCNKKLHFLWLLLLIPVGVAVFCIVKSKKTRSIHDDDL